MVDLIWMQEELQFDQFLLSGNVRTRMVRCHETTLFSWLFRDVSLRSLPLTSPKVLRSIGQ